MSASKQNNGMLITGVVLLGGLILAKRQFMSSKKRYAYLWNRTKQNLYASK